MTIEDMEEYFVFFEWRSRKPNRYRGIAPPFLEKIVCDEYEALGYGYRRMYKHLILKKKIAKEIKEWLIKWIYKRKKYKVRKVRTASKESVPLYNYKEISAFEYLHYDVKHILDKGALPLDIYEKFKITKDLPIYQRTIIEVKTRWRFLSYSNKINATLWLEFLKFTLMFIRNQWIDRKMTVWFDGWIEFCSASDKKLAVWNDLLKTINCEVYQYEWAKDIRKNLIERSHRSDDEEFYVPRWVFIKNRKNFLREARYWYLHRNYTRIHTGIEMWMTPYQKLEESWIWKLKWRDRFPVLILDECVWDLMYHTKTLNLKRYLDNLPKRIDQKEYMDFQTDLNILNNKYAHYVLTHYQIE